MLHAIGYVYVNKADQFLGNPLVCGSIAVRAQLQFRALLASFALL